MIHVAMPHIATQHRVMHFTSSRTNQELAIAFINVNTASSKSKQVLERQLEHLPIVHAFEKN